jgi:hypothetical protein
MPEVSRPFFSGKKLWFIAGGVVVVLAVALISYFMGRGAFSEGRVVFKIDGPTEISAGDLVTYKITYQNNNKVSLSNVEVNIFYPTDAVVVHEGNIAKVTNDNLSIGTLKAGESGEKDVTAYIVGDAGNIKTIKGDFSYIPQTINSKFQKQSTLATTITTLSVPIILLAPQSVIGGQNVNYIISYRNQSSQDLDSLRLEVKYPDGFKTSQFSPQPTSRLQGQDNWDIDQLKQSDGSKITIQGILSGKERDTKTISVILQKKVTTPSGDVYVDFEKTQESSVISTPLLSLNLLLNDSADYTAHLGDLLRYKINFKNNNNSDISGLTLTAVLNGKMYDPSSVQSTGFFDSRTNTITWNASSVSSLNTLGANQSAEVAFDVRLKPAFSGALGAGDSFVKTSVHLETPNVPSGLDLQKLSADDELVTRISTSPTFSQKVLVNDNVFGQSGPFPPVVNKKTNFTIRWNLVNPANDITPAKVTATLMPGVFWVNQLRVSGTEIQPVYDSRQNTVTWDLGTLPGGVGVNSAQYEADFQISITPSLNQVNATVPLLKDVRFDGADSFTKEKISRTIQDATTSLVNDSKASGAVQAQ